MPMALAASMPPITVVPMIWRATEPAPEADPQRHATENERERGHQDGPQAKPRAFERRIHQRLPLLVLLLGKLDDQNRVLGGQADQHHQADLRVDVVLDLNHVGRQEERRAQRGAATALRRRRIPPPACSAAR